MPIFQGEIVLRGNCPGSNYPEGDYLAAIVLGAVVQRRMVLSFQDTPLISIDFEKIECIVKYL